MKNIFQYIFGLFMIFSLATMSSCSPESAEDLDLSAVPQLNAEDIQIDVDQETNQVSFKVNKAGCNPIWQFEDGSKSTTNGLDRIFTIAGTYKVEVKLYNRNGVGDGSIVKEFTINNSIVDFTPYLTRLCGAAGNKTWMIAADEAGHLGCGPSGSDGLEWYGASANEKAGKGLYENRFSFATQDGTNDGGAYTYDPAESGTVFVNNGCSVFSQYNTNDGEDFAAPVEKQETNFTFTVSGTDLYIVFPAGTLLGYVPNDNIYNTPKFKVLSIRENKLELVADDGNIAWHLTYCPETTELTKEEMLASAAGKTWYWDQNNAGHLGCGPAGTDGLEWYSAAPNDKESFGLYNQSFIFMSDGTYKFNDGGAGVFVNTGCTVFADYNTNDGTDFMAPVGDQTFTWKFVEEGADLYLELPAQTYLGYIPNDNIYNAPKFKVLSIDEKTIDLVADDGTIAWHYRLVTNTGDEPEVFDEGSELMPSEYAQGLIGSWTWEASTFGHFGCGENDSNATGWWAAPANDKEGKGLYDDILTFNQDGSYIFNPGEGGTVFVNVGVTASPFVDLKGDATEDYPAAVETQTSSYTIAQEGDAYYITFPTQTLVSYLPSDDFYAAPKVKIVKMTENVVEFNTIQTGISWHYRLKRVK